MHDTSFVACCWLPLAEVMRAMQSIESACSAAICNALAEGDTGRAVLLRDIRDRELQRLFSLIECS